MITRTARRRRPRRARMVRVAVVWARSVQIKDCRTAEMQERGARDSSLLRRNGSERLGRVAPGTGYVPGIVPEQSCPDD